MSTTMSLSGHGTTAIARLPILDAWVDAVDMAGALAFAADHIAAGGPPATIMAINPEKIYTLRNNAFLRDFATRADLLIPDGIGVVIAARLLHGRRMERVPGADLMQALCAQAERLGHRVFLYGSSEIVNEQAAQSLLRRHPALKIVGRAHGYHPEDGTDDVAARINAAAPDLLFVALGSPRQERWMHANLGRLRVGIVQGIGGTLDTLSGHVRRAPVAFQRLGLEWFYRLLRQPHRLWRQRRIFRFACEVLCAALLRRRAPTPEHALTDAASLRPSRAGND